MLLAIDIGNSSITVGAVKLHDDKTHKIIYSFVISNKSYSSDEYAFYIKNFLRDNKISCLFDETDDSSDDSFIDCAVISSVVPSLTATLSDAVIKMIGKRPFIISSGIHTGFAIRIKDPSELGADMVCNVAAALSISSAPLVVLDMGTATTLTVVNSKSEIIGSIIIPGLGVSMHALSNSAALLPDVSLDKTQSLIGRDTDSAIMSGVVNGNILMIDAFIRNIRQEILSDSPDDKLTLIATGGYAGKIIPYTRNKFTYVDSLTLSGAATLYIKNAHKKPQ